MKQGGVYRIGEHRIKVGGNQTAQDYYYTGKSGSELGKVPMSVIDVTQSVFGLGLVGVILCRQEDGQGGC